MIDSQFIKWEKLALKFIDERPKKHQISENCVQEEIVKIRSDLDAIFAGKKLVSNGHTNLKYHFMESEEVVETEYHLLGKINALFCDGFDYISYYEPSESNLLHAFDILEYVISRHNIVFLQPSLSWFMSKQSGLYNLIEQNFGIFPVKVNGGLFFHSEGILVKKGASLRNIILKKETTLDLKKLSFIVKGKRKQKRLTQAKLIDKVNISVRTLRNVENGASCSYKTADLLSKFLNFSISEVSI